MQEFPINWLAVLVAAVVKQAIGTAWFSPVLLGPTWMKLVGCNQAEMKARLPKIVPLDIIGALIMAFVLVHAVRYAGANTLMTGAVVGFFNWLGFIAVTTFGHVLYERRPVKLFLIDNGYLLIALLLMGAILAVWP